VGADLKNIASDLNTFLKVVDSPPKKPAASPAAPPQKVEQTKPVVEAAVDPAKLARAAWDYVSSVIQESDSPDTIGTAYMVAIAALSKDANVPVDDLNNAAIDFLESIVDSARECL
jgi:hypothetical protein